MQCNQIYIQGTDDHIIFFHDFEKHGVSLEEVAQGWLDDSTQFSFNSFREYVKHRHPDVVILSRAQAKQFIPLINKAERNGNN